MDNYFQPVKLIEKSTVKRAEVSLVGQQAKKNEDILFLDGSDGDFAGDLIFLNYGLAADYEGKDVAGKIVVSSENSCCSTPCLPHSCFNLSLNKKGNEFL